MTLEGLWEVFGRSLGGHWEDPESDEDKEDDEASEAGNGKFIKIFLLFP